MLDQAFEALKKYDWGADPKDLKPIDEQVVATQKDAAARKELESRLAAALAGDLSHSAKDFLCRTLSVAGTAASVPVLAQLLSNPSLSHMARYALERIPDPAAAQALRDALPQLNAELKIGVICSLGQRRDAASVPALAQLLAGAEAAIARAAALALGAIRTAEAAQALAQAKPADGAAAAVADASLACAEGLLAAGKTSDAVAIYRRFAGQDQPRHVRLAATRGMLAGAGKAQN